MLDNKEDVEFISEVENAYEYLLSRESFPIHDLVMMFPPETPMEEAAADAVETAHSTGKTVLLAHEGYSVVIPPGSQLDVIIDHFD